MGIVTTANENVDKRSFTKTNGAPRAGHRFVLYNKTIKASGVPILSIGILARVRAVSKTAFLPA